MKLIAISDLHGHLPSLPSSDLVLIAGDIVPSSFDNNPTMQKGWFYDEFLPWCRLLSCKKIVLVGGNHDNFLVDMFKDVTTINKPLEIGKLAILCNSSIEFEGVKIYGTPLLSTSSLHCGFSIDSESLIKAYSIIEDNIDILLTHTPPFGIENIGYYPRKDKDRGSKELTKAIESLNFKYLICGHVHEANHNPIEWKGKTLQNVSLCNSDNIVTYDTTIIFINEN